MKAAYIGTKDQLSEAFIERMGKEENEVYLLSTAGFSRDMQGKFRHRYYQISLSGDTFRKVLKSISPDWIVFAGEYYMDSAYQEAEEADVALLTRTLQILQELKETKLLLLSSSEVYGACEAKADEGQGLMPLDEKGMRFAREEQMLELYRKQSRLDLTVARASQLYSDRAQEGGRDFLSRIFSNVAGAKEGLQIANDSLQPLHVSDFVDGIKRIMDVGRQGIYNVTGSYSVSVKRIYEIIEDKLSEKKEILWLEARGGYYC